MITRENLAGMTAEQVMQQFQEVKERRRAAIARANDAITGYQKAVDARDAKIKELRDDLSKKLSGIEDKAAALNAAMLKAAMAGDGAEQDKAQRALTELEGQRSQLNTRLELLNGKPPRCDEAYEAMNAAVAESEKADAQFYEDIGVIREFCEEVMQPWAEITSALRGSGESVSRFFLERAQSHYSSER